MLASLSAALCIIAFIVTVFVVSPIMDKEREEKKAARVDDLRRKILSPTVEEDKKNKMKQELDNLTADIPENPESPAVILGLGGLYGIVNGLGITEALTKYAESLVNSITQYLSNTSGILAGVFWSATQDLSLNTVRLLAFLVTIIPFIHGFILTFSNRWYYDSINQKFHYFWAFIFFIVVFIQTIILFLAALNVDRIELFVLMLWSLMVVNTVWLPFQSFIMKEQINIRHIFPKQWIILNFNTLTFLSVFALAPYELLGGAQDIANNPLLNFLILSVLLARSIADYTVGWKALYNRLPNATSGRLQREAAA
jgi:hypothetical protein